MILAILLPAFVAAALAVGYVYLEERRAQEKSVHEAVRAFALLVDNELETSEATLRALANSPSLAKGDLAEFYRHAQSLAPSRDTAIVLYDLNARQLLNTRAPLGSALPAQRFSNIGELMKQHGADRTLVSDLYAAPLGSRYDYVIQVPVRRDGRITHFLSLSSNASSMQDLLERQGFPDQWQAVIVDRGGHIIARLQEAEKFRGRLVRDAVLRKFAAMPDGMVSATNLAGIPMHGYFSTVPDSGWRVMVTIPQEEMRRVPQRAAAFLAAIMALLLVLAVAVARWFGQRALAPIDYLARSAEELGQGREVAYAPQRVHEFDAVARRLAEASGKILRAQGELERRVAEAVADSERAQNALLRGQKLEALGRLTGGIAHEFNNLLQTLTTALQMASLTATQPRVQSLLDTCKRTVGRAAALTTRLGSFGRVQDAKLLTVDPCEQVRNSVQLMRGVLRQDIDLQVSCAADAWPVTVDPLQFDLALLNLAINARDAMPSGGRLAIDVRNVALETTAERAGGECVRVRLADSGAGMPPEVLARALDPFFTTKAPGEGTGLGLPQAYAFATQSQGHLALASSVGAGTTVDIFLPRSRQALSPTAAAKDGVLPRAAGRVLFVEDDPLVREAVLPGLEESGFDVVVAASGDEALAMIEGGLDADVVFSDVVMPGRVSGIDLAAILHERRPGLPVVLATGYTDQRAVVPGVQVLAKPYEIGQLIELLGSLARANT
ncbi:response regulator [Massilia forsythiae]|uniref:histidine kinase n=1 Tax=Massilia forsythiae TaxID=2728020 RepID=A0A7Z2VU50_9BURK|nr:ATP-binding protein [Massilia forsythiae]QJD99527.1 response regulator [Massilia forsythiae]